MCFLTLFISPLASILAFFVIPSSSLPPPRCFFFDRSQKMGAVNGCHLKYMALSLIFGLGATNLPSDAYFPAALAHSYASQTGNIAFHQYGTLLEQVPFKRMLHIYLLYCAFLNLLIAVLFKVRVGMWIMLKNPSDGSLPSLTTLLLHPFLLPSTLYTYVHTQLGVQYHDVPVATEVHPGWWVGGRYGSSIPSSASPPERWTVTLDLTAEFPEACIDTTDSYFLIPTWDGQPPSVADVERGANFVATKIRDFQSSGKKGRPTVMVHCAHGRGRSCMSKFWGTWAEGGARDGRRLVDNERKQTAFY